MSPSPPQRSSGPSPSVNRPPTEHSAPLDRSVPSVISTRPSRLRGLTWERGLLLLILLVGGGYGLWQWLGPKAAGPGAGGPPAAMQGPPPRPVVTTTLQRGTAAQTVQVLGQAESSASTTLRSQTSGMIESLLVNEGDAVAEGDVIATLNAADQKLALAQAQARLAEAQSQLAELKSGTRKEVIAQRQATVQAAKAREAEARDNLKRLQALRSEGAIAERGLIEARVTLDTAVSDRLGAEAALAEANAGPRSDEIQAQSAKVAAEQAAVQQAQLEVQRTQIRATASGVVSQRQVTTGDYLRSADPVITLVDNRTVDIFLEVPEQLAGKVQPGMSVKLSSRAIPGWETTASIDSLLPIASADSRRRPARIRLAAPPPGLLPGTAVQASFAMPGDSSGYTISRDALSRRADQWLLFGVQEGTAEQIEVTLVSDLGETVIVDGAGLSSGQTIVLKGSDALSDGAPVMVVEGPGSAPPAAAQP